jgi:hypothetical protein
MTPRTLLALAAALAWLAGCASGPSAGSAQDSTKYTVENTDQFAALDPATQDAVSCTGLQERTLDDGTLEVVANLKNRSGSALAIQAGCTFLGGQGLPAGAPAAWQALSIAPGATEVVRFTASTVAAKRYAIRVRRAR